MDKIKVLIADDRLLREALTALINRDERFQVQGTSEWGTAAVIAARQLQPDIVLINIPIFPLPVTESVKQIRALTNARVIALSAHTIPAYVKKLVAAGAGGYLSKNASVKEMLEAFVAVHAGKKYFCKEIRHRIAEEINQTKDPAPGLFRITKSEIGIMSLLKKGLSSKEIAVALDIRPETVALHRNRIMKKLKLQNVSALINFISKHPDAENAAG